MSAAAQRTRLPDGRRWHFHHGPIDLILEAFGAARECAQAYDQAWVRFATILEDLVSELPLLRTPVHLCLPREAGEVGALAPGGGRDAGGSIHLEARPPPDAAYAASTSPVSRGRQVCALRGAVARRMWRACAPFAEKFITPMAAVAGAVAEEVLEAMTAGRDLDRAYVNNGGDIALYLAPGASLNTGIVGDIAKPKICATVEIRASDPVRGIATSGWRGRSFSLGIADAVTVLAETAAQADAAATMIANDVNVEHAAIERRPARHLDPDSDLGDLPVTVAVGALDQFAVARALDRGRESALAHRARHLIAGAYLELQGRRVMIGTRTENDHERHDPAGEFAAALRERSRAVAQDRDVVRGGPA